MSKPKEKEIAEKEQEKEQEKEEERLSLSSSFSCSFSCSLWSGMSARDQIGQTLSEWRCHGEHLPKDLTKRLLYILHMGFTQVRNLALAQGNTQIADPADAMEILPCLMDRWEEDHWELVRFVLRTYQEKYPGGNYDYLGYLEKCEPPERF